MKKIAILLVSVLLFAGCVSVTEGLYEDSNVSFDVPSDWIVSSQSDEMGVLLAKNTEVMADKEVDGWVNYKLIQNEGGLALQDYLTTDYNLCLEAFGPEEESDFAPPCKKLLVSELNNFKVNGYDVYQTLWYGVPQSGEMAKVAYVVVNGDESYFLKFLASRTGNTDIEKIDGVLVNIFNTLEIK